MKQTSIVCAVLLLATWAPVCAESLWTAEKDTPVSMFADRHARAVGDILTIIVVESSTSTSKASTDVNKKTDLATKPGVGPFLERLPEFGFSGSEGSTATGTTARSSNLVAKITVKVTKVLPKGNLEIEGARDVRTNNETQRIVLTGTIRQEDIAPDNTILSTSVADAKITHTGNGPIGSRMKEGILTKLIRILF